MPLNPLLVLAGGIAGLGLGAAALALIDHRQHHAEAEQAATDDDQFADLITILERT